MILFNTLIRALFIIIVLHFLSCSPSSEIVLISHGKTNAIIITAGSSEEKRAAEILQSYIYKSTSVNLPINPSIPNDFQEFKIQLVEDGSIGVNSVSYAWQNEMLKISSGIDIGIVQAVYLLLEKELGIRFYTPEVEKEPRHEILKVKSNLNILFDPPITTRTVYSRLFYENPDFAEQLRVTDEAFPKYAPSARVKSHENR